MIRLFEPKNDQELELVNIARNNPDKNTRQKAIKSLRVLRGLDKNDPVSIWGKEVYTSIKGRSKFLKRFAHATIYCDLNKLI
jgi:uncharacterized protein YpmB